MKKFVNAVVMAIALAPAAAAAQDGYRQTVVVTAAATPVELGTVTRTMTVITREQIAQLPVNSVADVLRMAASIDVRARGERGVQTDFIVRGASFGQMLVLVDGVRLNDAQTGHHSGDIPVPLDGVERVEVMYGPGSSLFGADAFGGTVNIITRRSTAAPSLTLQGGSFGLAGARGAAGFNKGAVAQTFAGSVERSSGFIDARDFETLTLHTRSSIGESSNVSLSFQRKEFGARNFYGASASGDALSREWTNQTLLAADHVFGVIGGWTVKGDASYRTHGDRFVFTPTSAASVHRTHETIAAVMAAGTVWPGARLAAGVEGGGTWIRSNNLGDHTLNRVSAYGELRQAFGSRTQLDASLRVDRYSEFGASWNPSIGVSQWLAAPVRLRASAGRAFRVPTFTERFYTDRNHLANSDVGPEHSWAGEGGADLFLPSGWLVQATLFARADSDVIDWLCANATCGTAAATAQWHTFNVRDVTTKGVEVSVRRSFGNGAFAQAAFTGLTLDAPTITQMSKYLLDFSPRSFVATGAVPLPGGLHVAPRLEYRRHGQLNGSTDYVLLDTRVGRRFGSHFELMVDGTNLLDTDYQEVPGVRMPGAAFAVSLAVGN